MIYFYMVRSSGRGGAILPADACYAMHLCFVLNDLTRVETSSLRRCHSAGDEVKESLVRLFAILKHRSLTFSLLL